MSVITEEAGRVVFGGKAGGLIRLVQKGMEYEHYAHRLSKGDDAPGDDNQQQAGPAVTRVCTPHVSGSCTMSGCNDPGPSPDPHPTPNPLFEPSSGPGPTIGPICGPSPGPATSPSSSPNPHHSPDLAPDSGPNPGSSPSPNPGLGPDLGACSQWARVASKRKGRGFGLVRWRGCSNSAAHHKRPVVLSKALAKVMTCARE